MPSSGVDDRPSNMGRHHVPDVRRKRLRMKATNFDPEQPFRVAVGASSGTSAGGGVITVEEVDLSPSVSGVNTLTVPSGSLTAGASNSALLEYAQRINGARETYQSHGSLGSTETINIASANVHAGTLDANCTFTFTGATSGEACSFTLILTEDGTGGWSPTWPASVVWPGATPTHTTTALSVSIYVFISNDGGATWYGFQSGNQAPLSYASNANQVGTANAGGASLLVSRGDHVHRGVHSLSHSSNTFYGDVTLAPGANVAITSPSSGTFTIHSTGGGGGGGATNLQSARYKRTSGDYTTTSTTFVDVDSTNFSFTFTTGARRVLLGLVGSCANSGTNSSVVFDVTVDGTRQGGTNWGMQRTQIYTATAVVDCSFTYLTDTLSAGSHTFKLQWRASADTATLEGSDPYCEFFAVELYA